MAGGRKRWWALAMACLALPGLTAGEVRAQDGGAMPEVIDIAPAGPQVMMVIPSLGQLSRKLAMLNVSLRMAVPGLQDSLAEFKRAVGLNKGLADEGSMLLAITDVQPMMNQQSPPFVLLLPAQNFAELVGNFGASADQPVVPLVLPTGHQAFTRVLRGYAVMSDKQDTIENYKQGPGRDAVKGLVGNLGQQTIAGSDVSIMVDLSTLGATLREQMGAGMKEALLQIERSPGTPQDQAMAKTMVTLYHQALDTVLRDASAMVLGIDLNEAGMGISFAMQFKAGSEMALQWGKGLDAGPLLGRLPNRSYLLATSMNFEGLPLAAIVQTVAKSFPAEAEWMSKMIAGAVPMLEKTSGAAQVMYAPQGPVGLGTNLLNSAQVVKTADPQGYVKAFQEYLTSMKDQRIPMGPAAGPGGGGADNSMTITTNYLANALASDDGQIDQYEFKYNIPMNMLAQMGQAGRWMMMLGGQGQSGYITAQPGHVIMTSTPHQQLVKDVMQQAKGGDGVNSGLALKSVRDHLTATPSFEMYLNVGSFAQVGLDMMMMMTGKAIPGLTVPADLPPLGMSASMSDGGIIKRLYVPMDTAQFVRNSSDKVIGHFMGGVAPGGPAEGQPGGAGDTEGRRIGNPPPR